MPSNTGLTERETEVLALAIQCSKDPKGIQIDYKKLAEVGGFKTTNSANTCWLVIKKKLLANALGPDHEQTSADHADDDSTPAKPAAKKRGPKPKAKAVVPELEAGAAADDEQTPTNSPKKTAGNKRKAAAIAESNSPEPAVKGEPEDGANESPAKKKRVKNRKPKDEDATPNKRGKKGAKATTPNDDHATANVGDATPAQTKTNGVQTSIFGDGNVKSEEQDEQDRPFDAQEQQYVKEKLADDKLFGSFVNPDEAGCAV